MYRVIREDHHNFKIGEIVTQIEPGVYSNHIIAQFLEDEDVKEITSELMDALDALHRERKDFDFLGDKLLPLLQKYLVVFLLFFCVSGFGQFYYSETQFKSLSDSPSFPCSVDGYLFTQRLPDTQTLIDEWFEKYPDGYEVYCDPCEVKTRDQEATEMHYNIGTAISIPYWIDTIVTKIDTIPVLMFMADTCSLTAPTFTIKGWLVFEGGFQKTPLNINKEQFTNTYMRSIGRLAGEGCYQVFNYVTR